MPLQERRLLPPRALGLAVALVARAVQRIVAQVFVIITMRDICGEIGFIYLELEMEVLRR